MAYIDSFLSNQIVTAWIAPIVGTIIAELVVHFILERKKREPRKGNNPRADKRSGSQGLLFFLVWKIMVNKMVGMIVVGILAFLSVRMLLSPGSWLTQRGDELAFKVNPAEPETLYKKNGEAEQWMDDDGTEYIGTRKDGKIEGIGQAVYINGERYEGEFKGGLRDGKGTLYSSSGLILYHGDWKDNVEEGKGINYFHESNGRYEGEFRAGQREGNGTYYWENGDRYEGKWESGLRNGMGVLIQEDGTISAEIWLKGEFVTNLIWDAETWVDSNGNVYTGKKVDGEIEGYGRVVYSSGNIYLGEFKGGYSDGKGISYYKNGDRYEGEWKDGECNGLGIYCFKINGGFYYGEWKDGNMDGKGSYFEPLGLHYEGEFKEGQFFGEGTKWYPSGDKSERWYFEGEWTEDSQIGTLYYKDGTCKTGIFKDDELVEETGEMRGIKDRDGATTWTDEEGVQYTGRKEDGVLVGEGIRIKKNKQLYIGEFAEGIPNGYGTEYYNDGDYYVGTFTDGMRNGVGVYYYSDGGESKGWYCGEWVDGERTGAGTIELFNNLTYFIGNYEDNYFSGIGSKHYTDGVYYGEWQNSERVGTGAFSASDGSCYFGEYRDNKISGYGVMYYADGSRYEGEWENGKKNGIGTEYKPDGEKDKYGIWVDDVYQN